MIVIDIAVIIVYYNMELVMKRRFVCHTVS